MLSAGKGGQGASNMAVWGFRDVFASELGSDLESASMFKALLTPKYFKIQSALGFFEGEKVNQAHSTLLPSRQAFLDVTEPLPALVRATTHTQGSDLLSLWLCHAAALWPLLAWPVPSLWRMGGRSCLPIIPHRGIGSALWRPRAGYGHC